MGVDRKIFEQIASVAERNGGRLPFRVDRERDIHGNDIDVARVLDLCNWAIGGERLALRLKIGHQ